MSRIIFEQQKTSFPTFRIRLNVAWTKRMSRTSRKGHQNLEKNDEECSNINDTNINDTNINDTRSDDKVVASYGPPRYLFYFQSSSKSSYLVPQFTRGHKRVTGGHERHFRQWSPSNLRDR